MPEGQEHWFCDDDKGGLGQEWVVCSPTLQRMDMLSEMTSVSTVPKNTGTGINFSTGNTGAVLHRYQF